MAYFGGGGVTGKLHPSLKAYIDCFLSAPFPKVFPRQGGIWDQDPILMRDFRIILNFEREWKQVQDQMNGMTSGDIGGGGLEDAMNEYLEELGEDGLF
jgi:hypothetical protein